MERRLYIGAVINTRRLGRGACCGCIWAQYSIRAVLGAATVYGAPSSIRAVLGAALAAPVTAAIGRGY